MRTSEAQQSRRWYWAFRDILSVIRHPSAAVLFVANLVLVTVLGIQNTMLLHVNSYFYGFASEQIGVFMLVIFFALVPSAWLAVAGTRRFGKRKAIMLFVIGAACARPMASMTHLYGLAPATGTTALLLFVCVFVVLQQTFYIAHIHIAGAMLPDVADEMELGSGLRQEGMLNSAMMLTQKVTFGLGAFFAGLAIDFAGFEAVRSVADTTPEMLGRLIWVYGPGLSLLTLVGVAVYARYGLDRTRCEAIQAQLATARA